MKKMILLFGVLDIVILLRSFNYNINLQFDSNFIFDSGYVILSIFFNVLLYLSLVPSAYFLIRQDRIGLWLTYGQFPLRIAFQALSFGFLWTLESHFFDERFPYILSLILVTLEVLRLIITVRIHKKYFVRATP
jgi:hypothetical protein